MTLESRRLPHLRAALLLTLLLLPLAGAAAFDCEGVWRLRHTLSQRISAGTVAAIYPPTGEWSPDLLVTGIQFLDDHLAYLHSETPGGVTSRDYPVAYALEDRDPQYLLKFRLENSQEIVLALFENPEGQVSFSYCDLGPSPGSPNALASSINKPVFRNHVGVLERIDPASP